MTQIKRNLTESFEVHCLHTLANLQHIDRLTTKILVNKKPILSQTFWAWLTDWQRHTIYCNKNFCKFLPQYRFLLQYNFFANFCYNPDFCCNTNFCNNPDFCNTNCCCKFLQYKFLLQIKYAHNSQVTFNKIEKPLTSHKLVK